MRRTPVSVNQLRATSSLLAPLSRVWEISPTAGMGPSCALFAFVLALLMCGCATVQRGQVSARHFDFQKDTFAFANELKWVYEYRHQGKMDDLRSHTAA